VNGATPDTALEPDVETLTQPTPALSFEAIQPGQKVTLVKEITAEAVDRFAEVSGDNNPLHMDSSFAAETPFRRRVVHGVLLASYVSTLVGTKLPGPGSLWNQQSFRWKLPVFIGDRIEITLTVTHKSEGTRTVSVEIQAVNQEGKVVMDGEGAVTIPEVRRKPESAAPAELVALVTGANSEIGAQIVRALAAAGMRVAAGYHHAATQAEEICESIRKQGGHAIPVSADLSDPDSLRSALAAVEQHFGTGVNVLVNHSGYPLAPKELRSASWSEIQAALNAELRGTIECCNAVLPGMLARKWGVIVNTGSIFSDSQPPLGFGLNIIGKAALKAYTRCLAAEVGPSGIRVNLVSTGFAETDFPAAGSDRIRKLQAMQTPLRRLATPEDIAGAIAFLCSDAAQFVTGADVPVCGGIAI